MKSFWPTWKLSACAAWLAVSAVSAQQPVTFATPFRSGMVLADWRGDKESNIVLQGRQPEEQTVFVSFGRGKKLKAESTGTEWRLRVKQLNESDLTPPSGPFNVEVETRTEKLFRRPKITGTIRLTNVLVGDVWVVVAESGRHPAPEIKLPGASVRFFLGDPATANGSGWFPAAPAAALPHLPAIAAYFAEALPTNQVRPVGIYVTDRLPLGTTRRNLPTWDGDGQLNYTHARMAAGAARNKVLQERREERAAFIGTSRAAKSQGKILVETLPPVSDDKFFTYGHRGAPGNSLPVFGQLHVHGFLW